MKRKLSLLMSLCMVTMCIFGMNFVANADVPVMEGAGTGANPYKITVGEQFSLIANNLTATYQLMNEITLPGTYVPITDFNGTLFSEGSCGIINVNIQMAAVDNIGLFATTKACTITNICIAGSVSGKNFVGGLIGKANGKINITNCVNNATINGNSSDAISMIPGVGGLIGCLPHPAGYQSTITNCVNTGLVKNYSGQCVGGVIGYLHAGASTISGCYNIGEIQGNSWIGGIAGAINTGTITKSYNKGIIRAYSTAAAGICGFNNSGTVSKSYNAGSVDSSANAAGIVAGTSNTAAKITGCYNTGKIYAAGTGYAGGICSNIMATGSSKIIEKSYNVGSTKSAAEGRTGGIYSGYVGTGVTLTSLSNVIDNCYYLNSDSAHSDGLSGTFPKSLSDIKGITDLLNTGLTENIFIAPTNTTYQFSEIVGNLHNSNFVLYEVTSTAGANGSISPSGIQYVTGGNTLTYTIIADAGYMVEGLTFGSADISILDHTQGGIYKTAAINHDINIHVTFIDFVFPEVIADDTITDKRSYVPESYSLPETIAGTEIDTPYGVSFSRVLSYNGYTLKEYGMLFSKTNLNLNMESYDHKAIGASKNSYGQFGILFYGDGIANNTVYYSRAYAIYEKEGESPVVILGTPSSFETK